MTRWNTNWNITSTGVWCCVLQPLSINRDMVWDKTYILLRYLAVIILCLRHHRCRRVHLCSLLLIFLLFSKENKQKHNESHLRPECYHDCYLSSSTFRAAVTIKASVLFQERRSCTDPRGRWAAPVWSPSAGGSSPTLEGSSAHWRSPPRSARTAVETKKHLWMMSTCYFVFISKRSKVPEDKQSCPDWIFKAKLTHLLVNTGSIMYSFRATGPAMKRKRFCGRPCFPEQMHRDAFRLERRLGNIDFWLRWFAALIPFFPKEEKVRSKINH